MQNNLLIKAEELKIILTRMALGESKDDDSEVYILLRTEFCSNRIYKNLLPDFVILSRALIDFWYFIQPKYATYKERRIIIREQFEPLFIYLEGKKVFLHDHIISNSVVKFNCNTIARMWEKALDRHTIDPDGAITAPRYLVESVCKQILIERNTAYEDSYLPMLGVA